MKIIKLIKRIKNYKIRLRYYNKYKILQNKNQKN